MSDLRCFCSDLPCQQKIFIINSDNSHNMLNIIHKLFSTTKILRTHNNDIYLNLATQEYLFETQKLNAPTLFLWKNEPTIVIGRHQNPWKQCKIQQMKANNILLSRRKTGGGAVYQDSGNTCFSFLTPYNTNQKFDYKTINNKILTDTFSRFNIAVEQSGRNDLVCNGKKISGSAYRLNLGGRDGRGKKALHHGTVLFSVDLNALQNYLNPNKKKLESKGIDSVKSRVMNLNKEFSNINHDNFCEQLEHQFEQHYNSKAERQLISYQTIHQKNPEIVKNYDRLRSWDWLYGECPKFKYSIQHKFDWGLIEITFDVEEGYIKEAKIYSDCLIPEFIQVANQEILGKVRYDREGILEFQDRLKGKIGEEMQGMAEDVCRWIIKQL